MAPSFSSRINGKLNKINRVVNTVDTVSPTLRATEDPPAPPTIKGNPVLAGGLLYKSNPRGLMQHRYFIVMKHKFMYYKPTDAAKVETIKPKGIVKFKDIDSYELKIAPELKESTLILKIGTRDFKLKRFAELRDSSKYSFEEAKILQTIVEAYIDYKKYKPLDLELVVNGNKRGLRFHEASPDKTPVYDCDPALSQEQINLAKGARVFSVARVASSTGDTYGVVFTDAGLTVIDPATSEVLIHSDVYVRDSEKYLGFNDSIGTLSGIRFRDNESTRLGLKCFNKKGAILEDFQEELQARGLLKATYTDENAKVNPLHLLTKFMYFYNGTHIDDSLYSYKDSISIARAVRAKQLIDKLLPLKYDENGNPIIPSLEVPEVDPELLTYVPEVAEKRTNVPHRCPRLMDKYEVERSDRCKVELEKLRNLFLEVQAFTKVVLENENNFEKVKYPQFRVENKVAGGRLSEVYKKYTYEFSKQSVYFPARNFEKKNELRDFNNNRHYYSEYHEYYTCYIKLVQQLQLHQEALIINNWLKYFLTGQYDKAKDYFDFGEYTLCDGMAAHSCLTADHAFSLYFLCREVVYEYSMELFNRAVENYGRKSQSDEELYMYELDSGFRRLQYEYKPNTRLFSPIVDRGRKFSHSGTMCIDVNYGYTIEQVNNSIVANYKCMVCLNGSFEIISVKSLNRYMTYKYSKEGDKHVFTCTLSAGKNDHLVGGKWVYDEDKEMMEWTGNMFKTGDSYYRYHVDKNIPVNVALYIASRGLVYDCVSNNNISGAYKRMLYNNIYVSGSDPSVDDKKEYTQPEILQYKPFKYNSDEVISFQAKSTKWSEVESLERNATDEEKEENKRRWKAEKLMRRKHEIISNMREVQELIAEIVAIKDKAEGKARDLLANLEVPRPTLGELTPEAVEAESDPAAVKRTFEASREDRELCRGAREVALQQLRKSRKE